jgi:hypothetical protein
LITQHQTLNFSFGTITADELPINFFNLKSFIMSGRGDKNKSGTSGQGASNQSNQGFGQAANRGKSSHGEKTGGKPSMPQEKTSDQSANRNRSLDKEEK